MSSRCLMVVTVMNVLVQWSFAATVYTTDNVYISSSGTMQMPQYGSSSQECEGSTRRSMLQDDVKQQLRLELKHRDRHQDAIAPRISTTTVPKLRLAQAIRRDGARRVSFLSKSESESNTSSFIVESTVESGATLGSGEYFMDALFGTPPKHLSLIIDTGSDLTWTQCAPCIDCYPQEGDIFNPAASTSYTPISCTSQDCNLVAAPSNDTCTPNASCQYFYSYGDSSNTTGDLARETMRLKVGETPSSGVEIEGVVFGCGHANKGLFRGASGLLGLGRGPLSVTSQVGWQKFAYCLVDRNNNLSVSSSISFGHEFAYARHGGEEAFRYTPFISGGVDTFYYLDVREFRLLQDTKLVAANVGDFLRGAEDGSGGLIIDSGTTLTYLSRPAYDALEALLLPGISYPRTVAFDVLEVCYNTSASRENVTFPGMSIVFGNGEKMELPASNLFIQPDPQEAIYCLAVLPTDGKLSILGNYQQQNMHLLYDCVGQEPRLGFLNTDCTRL